MTRELDNPLKQMFAALEEDLPPAGFTSEVMSGVLRPRRRERLLWSAAILSALAFLWFSFPVLEAGFRVVAESPQALFAVARESLTALLQSPVFYIYGMAFGGYVLSRSLRRVPMS